MNADELRNTIYQGDCLTVMRQLPGGVVDLIVTDPPYNIASDHALTMSNGRVMTTAEAWGAWDQYDDRTYRRFLAALMREFFRLLRPGGQLYVWLGTRYLGAAIESGEAAGFRFRAKLVAVKARPQPSWTEGNWRSSYEECLYFSKGRPWPFHFAGQGRMKNVLTLPYEPKESAHPTEKRPAMIAPLIEASSDPGDLVLDPFLGSGTTAVVARQLGRDYLGIEREDRYLAMALERLRAA
jgi:site-specific DNA-methyltransferase (adenine-specific)